MTHRSNHIRAFIAVSLPDHVKDYLTGLQRDLKKTGIRGSYPNPAAMHLTLRFIGDISLENIHDIKGCMAQAVDRFTVPIQLSASGIGVFPSVKQPRVIWAGVRGQTHLLTDLAELVNGFLSEKLGLKDDKKRFSAHITLSRVKRKIPPRKMVSLIQQFSQYQSQNFLVSDIKLFKSELKPSGAIHSLIFSVPIEK